MWLNAKLSIWALKPVFVKGISGRFLHLFISYLRIRITVEGIIFDQIGIFKAVF